LGIALARLFFLLAFYGLKQNLPVIIYPNNKAVWASAVATVQNYNENNNSDSLLLRILQQTVANFTAFCCKFYNKNKEC